MITGTNMVDPSAKKHGFKRRALCPADLLSTNAPPPANVLSTTGEEGLDKDKELLSHHISA